MSSYYYLISSLPVLNVEQEMPITYSEFLNQCKSSVSEEKFNMLSNLDLSSTDGPLLKEWGKMYKKLMKELNYERSMKLGKTYPINDDKDYQITQVVNLALSAKNPLEAEKILLDYEFKELDSLVGLHNFDDHVLFGYAIKLKLLERVKSFDVEKGKAEFKSLFDEVQKRVYSI